MSKIFAVIRSRGPQWDLRVLHFGGVHAAFLRPIAVASHSIPGALFACTLRHWTRPATIKVRHDPRFRRLAKHDGVAQDVAAPRQGPCVRARPFPDRFFPGQDIAGPASHRETTRPSDCTTALPLTA